MLSPSSRHKSPEASGGLPNRLSEIKFPKIPLDYVHSTKLSDHINGRVSNIFFQSAIRKTTASLLTSFKLKNIQAYRLATALICYGEGRGINEIAILFGISVKTVVNWLLIFMSGGICWVMGKHYHGRGRKEN